VVSYQLVWLEIKDAQPKKLKLRLKLGGETTSHTVTLVEYDKKPANPPVATPSFKVLPATTLVSPAKQADKTPPKTTTPTSKAKTPATRSGGDKSKKKTPEVSKKRKSKEIYVDEDDDSDNEYDLFGGSSSDLELDYDEDEELMVDDEEEDLPPITSPLAGEDDVLSIDGDEDGLYDEFDEFSGINKKLTTRQIAMQTGTAGTLLSLPMPDKRSSGKATTEEARLKKASQAERRKRKQEIDQRQQKETVINQLLNRSAKSKKGDEIIPKVAPKSLIPQITYISGVKGNVLIFPENQPIPEFLMQKATTPVPNTTKCAAPKCTNAKRYNDSRTQKPLCSLECYKIVNSSVSTAGTAK